MGSLRSLAQGFLVATGLVWLFNITALMLWGDSWLGFMYLLVLLIPITSIALVKLKSQRQSLPNGQRWRSLLFSVQGIALGFWMFDIVTTFYAINVTKLAIELNPLGWPWGILGALAFFGPTLAFSYILLFRMKERISLFAAVPLTLLTLGMGTMNFFAGAQNFQVFVDTAYLAIGVRYSFLTLLLGLNLAFPLGLRWMSRINRFKLE
jgi:hypothetical protein